LHACCFELGARCFSLRFSFAEQTPKPLGYGLANSLNAITSPSTQIVAHPGRLALKG